MGTPDYRSMPPTERELRFCDRVLGEMIVDLERRKALIRRLPQRQMSTHLDELGLRAS